MNNTTVYTVNATSEYVAGIKLMPWYGGFFHSIGMLVTGAIITAFVISLFIEITNWYEDSKRYRDRVNRLEKRVAELDRGDE